MTYGLKLLVAAALSLPATLLSLPQQTEEGSILCPGGGRLHFRLTGSGRDTVVVIADGPGGHINAIAPDLATLTRRHRVLFYDQRGSGTSAVPPTAELRLEDHVRDLETLRMYVGMRRVKIVAHGWGAAIAAQYALRYPDKVERMALLAPSGVRRAWLDSAQAIIDARLDEAARTRIGAARAAIAAGTDAVANCRAAAAAERVALFADTAAARRLRGNPCGAPPEALRFTYERVIPAALASLGDYDMRSSLAAVARPTLIVHGEADVTPLAAAQEWAGALGEARLLVLPGAGHFPHVEGGTAFWTALDTFLAGSWPAGANAVSRAVAAAGGGR